MTAAIGFAARLRGLDRLIRRLDGAQARAESAALAVRPGTPAASSPTRSRP